MLALPVLILGFANAGKSTAVGTLLGGTYSPSSTKPCTQVVCKFVVHQGSDSLPDGSDFQRLAGIQQVIHDANNSQLHSQDTDLREMTFHIRARQSLVAEMHEQVQLEIVDVPGWNSDSVIEGSRIAKFITSNWDTFGAVIVVLDVRATTSNRQEELLTFLQKLNQDKSVPILVVANKVDSIYDDGVEEALADMVETTNTVFKDELNRPQCLSISTKAALFYSCARRLDLPSFLHDYKSKLDQIGTTVFSSSSWRRFKPEDQELQLFNKLRTGYDSAMSSDESNFQMVLDWIDATLGGNKQPPALERILVLKLKKITLKTANWINKLHLVSDDLQKAKVLHQEVVVDQLFGILQDCAEEGHKEFAWAMQWSQLTKTLNDLQVAGQRLHLKGAAINKRTAKLKEDIADRFCSCLIEKFNIFHEREWESTKHTLYKYESSKQLQANTCDPTEDSPPCSSSNKRLNPYISDSAIKRKKRIANGEEMAWSNLSAFSWKQILNSLLCVPGLSLRFPKDHRFVTYSLDAYGKSWGLSKSEQAPRLFDPKTREFIQSNGTFLNDNVRIVCDHPKNPKHWGHILWLCAEDVKGGR